MEVLGKNHVVHVRWVITMRYMEVFLKLSLRDVDMLVILASKKKLSSLNNIVFLLSH